MKDKIYNFEKDREKVRELVNSDNFNHLIMFLIIFDSMILGFLTSGFVRVALGFELFLIDRLIVALFISEMLMKIYAFRGGFFKSGWNILDLSVVVISIIPATSFFVILRGLRLLRLVKYMDKNKKISQFFEVFASMLPTFFISVTAFAFVLYAFSIMAVGLFGDVFVEFSSLSDTMLTFLQMLTLDGAATNVVGSLYYVYPHSWVFFLIFNTLSYLIAITFVIVSLKNVISKK